MKRLMIGTAVVFANRAVSGATAHIGVT